MDDAHFKYAPSVHVASLGETKRAGAELYAPRSDIPGRKSAGFPRTHITQSSANQDQSPLLRKSLTVRKNGGTPPTSTTPDLLSPLAPAPQGRSTAPNYPNTLFQNVLVNNAHAAQAQAQGQAQGAQGALLAPRSPLGRAFSWNKRADGFSPSGLNPVPTVAEESTDVAQGPKRAIIIDVPRKDGLNLNHMIQAFAGVAPPRKSTGVGPNFLPGAICGYGGRGMLGSHALAPGTSSALHRSTTVHGGAQTSMAGGGSRAGKESGDGLTTRATAAARLPGIGRAAGPSQVGQAQERALHSHPGVPLVSPRGSRLSTSQQGGGWGAGGGGAGGAAGRYVAGGAPGGSAGAPSPVSLKVGSPGLGLKVTEDGASVSGFVAVAPSLSDPGMPRPPTSGAGKKNRHGTSNCFGGLFSGGDANRVAPSDLSLSPVAAPKQRLFARFLFGRKND